MAAKPAVMPRARSAPLTFRMLTLEAALRIQCPRSAVPRQVAAIQSAMMAAAATILEGWANFWRLHATDPLGAAKVAPQLYRWAEARLRMGPGPRHRLAVLPEPDDGVEDPGREADLVFLAPLALELTRRRSLASLRRRLHRPWDPRRHPEVAFGGPGRRFSPGPSGPRGRPPAART